MHPCTHQLYYLIGVIVLNLSVLPERRQKFLQHFQKLQNNGRVTAQTAWNFFNQSRLDREVGRQIDVLD